MTPANPVVDAEFHHQRFVIRRGRVGGIWIILAGLMVAPALLASILFTFGGLLLPIIEPARDLVELSAGDFPAWLWLAIMNLAMYPVVTLVTFALSANSIRREKQGKTWDNLRLTGLNPQQIVIGKWWASVRALNGDHAMLVVMRLGIAALFVMTLNDMIASPFGLPPAWTILPILIVFTICYGFLDASLTAALGIAGAMVDIGGPIVPFTLFAVRVTTAFGALLLWIGTLFVIPAGIGLVILLSVGGFIGYALVIWMVLRVAQQLVN